MAVIFLSVLENENKKNYLKRDNEIYFKWDI